MYNLLVVDDEKYAVKGISQGIDWSDIPFDGVFEAMDVGAAKEWFQQHRIDVLISDIEMPGCSGIELLKWVKEHSPATETIFLTGHAHFSYAQQAIQIGSFDYVLKPVDHDELKGIVRKAIRKIEEGRQQQSFNEMHKYYYKQWQSQLPILVERFWQDVIGQRVSFVPDRIQGAFDMYDIPLRVDGKIIPILISIEYWREDLDSKDEEIMEYALRKAAEEIILKEDAGAVLQDQNRLNLVFIYCGDGGLAREDLLNRCREYVRACKQYFYCHLSSYVGVETPVADIAEGLQTLLNIERNNVTLSNGVIDQKGYEEQSSAPQKLFSFSDWAILFESGKRDELLARIRDSLEQLQRDNVHSESLEAVYFGILSLIYDTLHKKGLSVREVYLPQELQDMKSATRTVQHLRAWSERVIATGTEYFANHHKDVSSVIAKVQEYIVAHLSEDLHREQIAATVYLNPAYLSRLFKKETGKSLSEYIAEARMERAKKLLVQSNDKVSNIAEAIGYVHFSHFAKMFKKITGVTPQEYRKMF